MRSTQQPRAQIKTQFVELFVGVQSLKPCERTFESECYIICHFDIVCVDFQHLTQLVDVAIESIVRMMLLPHFFSRAKAW